MWNKVIQNDGLFCGLSTFGASGKAEELFKHFGLEAANIASKIKLAIKNINKVEK